MDETNETLDGSITVRLTSADKNLVWTTAEQVAARQGYEATASAVVRKALRSWAVAARKKLGALQTGRR